MVPVFLCGPLGCARLREVVFGGAVAGVPAVVADAVGLLGEGPLAFGLGPRRGAQVAGLLADLAADPAARLAFFAEATGWVAQAVTVTTARGPIPARAYAVQTAGHGTVWDAALWQADHAELAMEAAKDVMAGYGQIAPARLRARLASMLVRADSRLRARLPQVASVLRRAPVPVAVQAVRQPYAHFFAVEEYDLTFARFDGTQSPLITRATFVSADAVTVLPYDPARDRVLVVEQMRAGPLARGDSNPWQLEAIAGRIDAGESPEAAARREALEEAGVTLGALLPVANYYPSPGAKTEFLYSYVALADLADGAAGVFGVEEEAEDIRGHLLGFDDAMALVASGEIQTAPLVLTLLWLQRERPRLRQV